jgi:carbohydrate binding protein with CBM4/9 domain/PEP-CTERM motif-containing protein
MWALPGKRKGSVTRAAVMLALLVCTSVTAAQANLITNGGFEDGLSGWTATELGSSIYVIASPNSGQYAAVLANESASLSQTFATTPGEQYLLSFWLYNSGPPNYLQTLVNGTALSTQTDLSWQPYTASSLTFVADSALTTLEFNEGHGWTGNFYLDDVSVDPVPEPATLFLIGSGITGLMGVRLRRKRIAA